MKTAVLVFGMMREYDSTMVHWKLDKFLDCDYYFSTWRVSKQKYDNFSDDSPENFREYIVTEEMIKNVFPNSVCSILDENEIFGADCKSTYSKMFFHWRTSYDLMIKSSKNYDLVILIRPDCPLTIHSFAISHNDETDNPIKKWDYRDYLLYSDRLMTVRPRGPKESPNNPCEYLYSDMFFCGSFEVMNKFMSVIPDMSLHSNKCKNWVPHVDLANLLYPIGLYPSDIHPFFVDYPSRPKKQYD